MRAPAPDLRSTLRTLMRQPDTRAALGARLGLTVDALHALRWARCMPGHGGWTLGFADGCAGHHLPRTLRGDAAIGLVSVRSVRARFGRLESASICIGNTRHQGVAGTLTALLQRRSQMPGHAALTAGHVLVGSAGAKVPDRIHLFRSNENGSTLANGCLLDWEPSSFVEGIQGHVDIAIAGLDIEAVTRLIDAGLELPVGTDSLVITGQDLRLRTRDATFDAQTAGSELVWMHVADDADAHQYRLVDAVLYRCATPTLGGDSGAPLWDDQDQLVAMHVGQHEREDGGERLGVAVRTGYVENALRGWQCEVLTRSAWRARQARPVSTPMLAPAARPATSPAPTLRPTTTPAASAGDTVDTLARTIWGEARGEPDAHAGMAAVACVVMNRFSRQTYWGKTVREVCRKPFQFSCWNANDRNLDKLSRVTAADPQVAIALGIAASAVAGTLRDDTQRATHYYARSLPHPPRWALGETPCASIGKHLFFNNIR